MVFAIDEAASLLMETGYRKPISKLDINDKACLRSSLVDFHCIFKSKAALDQFAEGLSQLNVLDRMKCLPDLMKPLFVKEDRRLTASKFVATVCSKSVLRLMCAYRYVEGYGYSEV